jgi:hypothetical protein
LFIISVEPFAVDTDNTFAVTVLPNSVENPPNPTVILEISAVDVVNVLPNMVDATIPPTNSVEPVSDENRTVLPLSVDNTNVLT